MIVFRHLFARSQESIAWVGMDRRNRHPRMASPRSAPAVSGAPGCPKNATPPRGVGTICHTQRLLGYPQEIKGRRSTKPDHDTSNHGNQVAIPPPRWTPPLGKPGHAVCKQGASQRRCKADMSDIGARKAPHEARESERGARPKQMVAKTGAPVAGADEERQQGREREKVLEGTRSPHPQSRTARFGWAHTARR